ncbi:breast cancer anti-estrogen resistance protein 3 homolog isoform X1 [Megalobrama amblycephala]|uniref:breast cancer anti-estrogen resistance protein 3 homolog isoform X1 n=2 Tax=Megalobrama amblycephala TaxID=75352 RepID=UPI0020140546|nr:breast cancer anti-estrogen resistance protein 3 homolog isoform X1 [Megalobrama amblycephala]XP_048051006.1 breast cancer anti-estrogen resistance protein 3 homolog isoform X1 [Megalobrama amblycephala]
MNNRSIARWLSQIGLPQYTSALEKQYYGLEGLLSVTDEDLRLMGVEDPDHRTTIIMQLQSQQQKTQPEKENISTGTMSRKYSRTSTADLFKTTDLFRHSIVPRLRRRDNQRVSASCLQLCDEDHAPSSKLKLSRRKSVSAFISQVFSGLKDMDSLKKELEEELKLSTEDLRSHAWYHGQLQREGAEHLLSRDGEFLVRDSSSSAGEYVLSCMWKNQPMHFKIIRVVLRPKQGYTRELFQFENDQFNNIPALIRFHVGGRRPISNSIGAIIFQPITRTVPLRIISERQAARSSSSSTLSRGQSKRRSLSSSQKDTLQVNNLLRSGSQPANLETVGRPSLQSAQSDSNLRTGVPQSSPSQESSPAPISPVFRTGSEPVLSPAASCAAPPSQSGLGGSPLRGSDGQLHSRAPPKPLRISIVFTPTQSDPESDPGGLYGELVPQVPITMLPKGHAARLRAQEKWTSRARLTETSFGFLEAQKLEEERRESEGDERDWCFERPQTETTSCFRLDEFRSLLLPDNNRPLDQSVLLKVKELLTLNDPRTTALHMLSVNCQVARVTGVTAEQKRIMGVESGLELVTLPHGGQLRQDLLERHHILALGVAVDLLGCTGTVGQRATVLHRIIQLAQELRNTTQDLYAFSAVMKALELPQVVRLEMTWRALRRSHTESAVTFEKSLKPFMKSLNEGDDAVVSGPLSLPHMVPLLRLMEGEDSVESTDRGCQLLYNLLQSARNAALHASDCTRHAHGLLSDGWEPIPELLEVFQTEFALRLFWGQTGAKAEQKERWVKFDRILTVLSNKLEPDGGSEV